ncbi:MAG TPA: metallophosphoesterase [Burkholderiaceae bacterium]|nr:metallophosphoesterase [Burkholderiaceae bacterium]
MPRFSFLLRLPVILALAHGYVAVRMAGGLSRFIHPASTGLMFAALYALIMAGFLMRRKSGRPAGDALAWAGFLALGLFSWLFVLTVLRDLALLVAGAAWLVWSASLQGPTWLALRDASALAVPSLAVAATLAGLFNARRRASVRDVDIEIPGLAATLDGYTLVQITDLHVGPTIKRRYVDAVVRAANRVSPDAIVLTGDLVDGSVAQLASHVAPLADLQAGDGVYAVTGNHEYYSGAQPWVAHFRTLGIQVLMNEHRAIQRDGTVLVLAGVTDFNAGQFDGAQESDPAAAMRGAPADAAYRILLAHQPRSAVAAAAAGFDLQLSGHTHGGQIWPWKYLVPLQQPFVAGLHRQGDMQVYVSRGTGYWGPPMRIGAPSEIARIRLRRTKGDGSLQATQQVETDVQQMI